MTPFCIVEKRTEKAMDYFCPQMTLNEVNAMSMLGLAHIGDGVYELLTRTMLCKQGHSASALYPLAQLASLPYISAGATRMSI